MGYHRQAPQTEGQVCRAYIYCGRHVIDLLPILIMDVNCEVPRPWVMASQLQDIGLDENSNTNDEEKVK